MIEFSYNEEENIIYVTRIGEIDLQDILTSIKEIDDNFESLDCIYIIDDLRHSTTLFNQSDFPRIIEEVKKRVYKYNEIRVANIVDNPRGTALSILYQQITENVEKYNYKTFSTIEAAMDWLKLNRVNTSINHSITI